MTDALVFPSAQERTHLLPFSRQPHNFTRDQLAKVERGLQKRFSTAADSTDSWTDCDAATFEQLFNRAFARQLLLSWIVWFALRATFAVGHLELFVVAAAIEVLGLRRAARHMRRSVHVCATSSSRFVRFDRLTEELACGTAHLFALHHLRPNYRTGAIISLMIAAGLTADSYRPGHPSPPWPAAVIAQILVGSLTAQHVASHFAGIFPRRPPAVPNPRAGQVILTWEQLEILLDHCFESRFPWPALTSPLRKLEAPATGTYAPEHRVWTPHPAESVPSLSVIARNDGQARLKLFQTAITHFGGVDWPDERLDPNFLFEGSIGSGKSTHLLMTFFSMIGPIEHEGQLLLRHRGVVADPKGDMLPLLLRCIPNGLLLIVDPYHVDRVALDLSRMLPTPSTLERVAELLIPPPGGKGEDSALFFSSLSRRALHAVLEVLWARRAGPWTLWDVIRVLLNPRLLQSTLRLHTNGAELLSDLFPESTQRTNGNITQTIMSFLGNWVNIAYHQHTAATSICLRTWVTQSGSVLYLRGDPLRPEQTAWNKFVLTLTVDCLLARPDRLPIDETVIAIDEVRLLPFTRLTEASLLLRSHGARLLVDFQDPHGMFVALGDNAAKEWYGQHGNTWKGSAHTSWTQRIYSDQAGAVLQREETPSITTQYDKDGRLTGTTHATNPKIERRDNIWPTDWARMGGSFRHGFHGVASIPGLQWHATTLPCDIARFLPTDLAPLEECVRLVTEGVHKLDSFTEADLRRLGLPASFTEAPSPGRAASSGPGHPKDESAGGFITP